MASDRPGSVARALEIRGDNYINFFRGQIFTRRLGLAFAQLGQRGVCLSGIHSIDIVLCDAMAYKQ